MYENRFSLKKGRQSLTAWYAPTDINNLTGKEKSFRNIFIGLVFNKQRKCGEVLNVMFYYVVMRLITTGTIQPSKFCDEHVSNTHLSPKSPGP